MADRAGPTTTTLSVATDRGLLEVAGTGRDGEIAFTLDGTTRTEQIAGAGPLTEARATRHLGDAAVAVRMGSDAPTFHLIVFRETQEGQQPTVITLPPLDREAHLAAIWNPEGDTIHVLITVDGQARYLYVNHCPVPDPAAPHTLYDLVES